MDECIDALGDAIIFSTLDCNSGYWKIPISDEERDKKAFVSHCGLFRWLCMPFGLKNAPGTSQRAADVILAGVKRKFSLVFFDDIIIYSSSNEEHYDDLATVHDVFHKAVISLKLHK